MRLCSAFRHECLRKSPFFSERDTLFLEMVIAELEIELFQDGETIISQGDHGDKMYFLYCGDVDVFVGPNEVKVARLSSGTVFGEMALFGQHKRAATIRAAGFVDCRVISHRAFNAVLKRFPKDREFFMNMAAERLAQLQQVNEKAAAKAPETPPPAALRSKLQAITSMRNRLAAVRARRSSLSALPSKESSAADVIEARRSSLPSVFPVQLVGQSESRSRSHSPPDAFATVLPQPPALAADAGPRTPALVMPTAIAAEGEDGVLGGGGALVPHNGDEDDHGEDEDEDDVTDLQPMAPCASAAGDFARSPVGVARRPSADSPPGAVCDMQSLRLPRESSPVGMTQSQSLRLPGNHGSTPHGLLQRGSRQLRPELPPPVVRRRSLALSEEELDDVMAAAAATAAPSPAASSSVGAPASPSGTLPRLRAQSDRYTYRGGSQTPSSFARRSGASKGRLSSRQAAVS